MNIQVINILILVGLFKRFVSSLICIDPHYRWNFKDVLEKLTELENPKYQKDKDHYPIINVE